MISMTDAARIAELEDDNRRLRRLLDQRDAPGELRHRLRSTLAVLRTVIRSSAATRRDIDAYVAQLDDRIDAMSRAHAAADQHGEVALQQVLLDELQHYGAPVGDRVTLSGPDVRLRPRAGQVLALALHELAVNAVEHGALGALAGRLDVAWTVEEGEPERRLAFTWKETGPPTASGERRQGFGTEVLTRMLQYELKAETALAFEPDGLRCTIRLALPDSIGRLASA